MKNTQVAVIGCGYLGRFHAEKYARLSEVELVGVVDTNYSRAEELAGQVHTIPFVNYQDVFTKIQAVSIVVPTPLHHAS